MVGALAFPYLDPILDMVLCQATGADHRIHLGARHSAPPAYGSAHELCLEIYAAHGARGGGISRGLALSSPGFDAMAGQHGVYCRCLSVVGPRRGDPKQDCETNLSFCRVSLMSVTFFILAAVTLIGACAAMMLRGLVHCALALAVAFAGLGTLYLNLGAQFLGLAQLLVYVGAIAVLIVFVILLTRGGESSATPLPQAALPLTGLAVAGCLFAV